MSWPWPTLWQGAGRVHAGYCRHLNMIGHQALEMTEEVAAETPFAVTGHSMGGALATLFAAWYYDTNADRPIKYRLAGLVTFGAPKALDRAAARVIGCPIRRYLVDGDLAAHWLPVWGLIQPATATFFLRARHTSHGPLRRHHAWGYFQVVREQCAYGTSPLSV